MMMSEAKRVFVQTKGIVIGRILIGLLFFGSGLGMLMSGPANTAAYFESIGLPLAGILVWLVIVLKIVAGGAIIIGKHVGQAAALLAAFTFLTILVAHRDPSDPGMFKNLAIIGGLLYVMGYGAGQWSSPKTPPAESVDM